MSFRVLGCRIEYLQAAKRLEEIAHALPGTPQEQERKELILLFREYEIEIQQLRANQPHQKQTF
jgi:hypothetical protein